MAARGLGKGLDALIPNANMSAKQEKTDTFIGNESDQKEMMKITKIEPNRKQPRKFFNEDALQELADSIKQFGLLQPILVQDRKTYYEIVAGERRWRAAKLAGLKEVPVIIRNFTEQEIVEISLIENIQREDLNPVELAIAYKELIEEYKITQDGLSEIIHKSRTQITNTIRLLSLSDQTKKYLAEGVLSQGHAKVLVGLEPKDEETIVNTILGQKLSVRETEALVKKLKSADDTTGKQEKTISAIPEELQTLKSRLKELGFEATPKANTITIHFKNGEAIYTFLEQLK